MLHGVASQGGVIGLEIQFEMIEQIVLAQKIQAGGRVAIVLVLGRFFGLGLDVELTFKANLLSVVDGQVKETPEMIEFTFQVGIPKGGVAFPPAPKSIALASEFVGDFEGFFDLGGGKGEGVSVAAGGGSVHVARVDKQLCRAPEKLDARSLLLTF